MKTKQNMHRHALIRVIESKHPPGMKKALKPVELPVEELLKDAVSSSADWSYKVRSYFGPASERHKVLNTLATGVLCRPEAINHPDWPALIKEFIDCSQVYEDVSADVYGEVVNYEDDDEGPLREDWAMGNYSTLEVVFTEILMAETACRNPAWKDLVIYAMNAQLRYDYHPESEIKNLFASNWVKGHSDLADLVIEFVRVKAQRFLYNQEVEELLGASWVKEHREFKRIAAGVKQIQKSFRARLSSGKR